jgi:RHS repeat-associated protein
MCPSAVDYGYHANGSQVSRERTEADETVSTTTSSYDLRNRLAEVATATVPGSGPTVTDTATYTYDDDGNRVAVREVRTSGGTTTSDVTTRYNQDVAGGLAQVIEEYTGTNTTPGMSYVEGDVMLGQAAGTAFGWFLVDGQMSTREVADGSGAITARLAYDGFGNAVAARSGATAYQYTNQRFDAAAGGYDLRARVYDAGTGRFTAADAFAGWVDEPLSLHDYAYCWNDPIGWSDPSGYAPNIFGTGYFAYAAAETQAALAGMAAVGTALQNAKTPEEGLLIMSGAVAATMNLTFAGINLAEAWNALVEGRPAARAKRSASRSPFGNADRNTPIEKLLAGKGQLKDLYANPNLKGANMRVLVRKTIAQLEDMLKRGEIDKRTFKQIAKAFEDRSLGGRW